MKTIVIVTPSNIEVEYRLAGAGSRLAAFVIDFLIQIASVLFIAFIFLFGFSGLRFPILEENGVTLAIVIITGFSIHFGYFIFCEWMMNGQTPGKRIFGLRVIRDNGQPAGFTQILVRGLFRTAIDMMYIGLFSILFSKTHKRFGDMAAGTAVISEHHEKTKELALPADDPFGMLLKDPSGMQTPLIIDNGMPLTAEEQRIINEWRRRRDTLPDRGECIRQKIEEYFEWKKRIQD